MEGKAFGAKQFLLFVDSLAHMESVPKDQQIYTEHKRMLFKNVKNEITVSFICHYLSGTRISLGYILMPH